MQNKVIFTNLKSGSYRFTIATCFNQLRTEGYLETYCWNDGRSKCERRHVSTMCTVGDLQVDWSGTRVRRTIRQRTWRSKVTTDGRTSTSPPQHACSGGTHRVILIYTKHTGRLIDNASCQRFELFRGTVGVDTSILFWCMRQLISWRHTSKSARQIIAHLAFSINLNASSYFEAFSRQIRYASSYCEVWASAVW